MLLTVLLAATGVVAQAETVRLVFGSFIDADNARQFAAVVGRELHAPIEVSQISAAELTASVARTADLTDSAGLVVAPRYRVVGPLLDALAAAGLAERARQRGYVSWRWLGAAGGPAPAIATPAAIAAAQAIATPSAVTTTPAVVSGAPAAASTIAVPAAAAVGVTVKPRPTSRRNQDSLQFDLDLGVQNRLFAHAGGNNSDQSQYSVSGLVELSQEFRDGSDLLRLAGFGRWDSDDSRRSHADLREASWTHIADSWQLQAGVGQVFWGVVEFNHLIDVVNQTDLVENPDGEDKLGQPMVTFTSFRDWGSVELYVLPGFRERTLPGIDGRLTLPVPIDRSAAVFESGAEDKRVDGLLRVSTQLGGLLLDAYHFNGIRRTPRFEPAVASDGSLLLVPHYDTVDQSALALQTNAGDTAFKLEALRQSGGPERYWAGAIGVEHTFVGVFGGQGDVGAVLEYHHDSRGDTAFDSFFERDLALGARFALNDLNDSQALLGVVWDTVSHESVVLLEASRRLNDRWSLELESRWFGGGTAVDAGSGIADLLDPENKLGALQRDDYIQFEFTRFF